MARNSTKSVSMFFRLKIFVIFTLIFQTRPEKMLLKVHNCTGNAEYSRVTRCEVIESLGFFSFDIFKPVHKGTVTFWVSWKSLKKKFNFLSHFHFQLELCFYQSRNNKFHLLGKCQRIDRCNIASTSNQIMKKFFNYMKYSGIPSLSPCPLIGPQEFLNVTLFANFLTFLPRGILVMGMRVFNNEAGTIIGTWVVFSNR